jgi:death on curing protein
MTDPIFLTLDQVLYIQKFEAEFTNSPTLIRDQGALEAALAAPQASFGGEFLMDLFEMAAAYVISLAHHHPFLDGNKRTAAGAALAFLSINGYHIIESHDEELADILLDFLNKTLSKEDVASYLKSHAVAKET